MRRLVILTPPDEPRFEKATLVLDGVVQDGVTSLEQAVDVFEGPGPLPDSVGHFAGKVNLKLTYHDDVVLDLGYIDEDVQMTWRTYPTCSRCAGRGWVLAALETEA